MAPTDDTDDPQHAKREYSQLHRMQERMVLKLQRMRDELQAPGTKRILKDIRARTGNSPDDLVQEVTSQVEEAIRAMKLAQSEIEQALIDEPRDLSVEGVPNLPAPLARFLAERSQHEGFTYEVVQDEVRGWVICWKEYTVRGTVRGYGQFYERPYAWLEE